MAFVLPNFSKAEVNRAGDILAARLAGMPVELEELEKWVWASDVLANWRACHLYPINTFQATLRSRLKRIDPKAIVAQRLKRAPSVIAKLQRFHTMKLAQMQDIGGLRAVVRSVAAVRRLDAIYREGSLAHKLVSSKDYIAEPKRDGYRSVHIVYQYQSAVAPSYNGLLLELQLRTKLQHAWATAVETMGTFLGQALKSGQGERRWRSFFEIASAAITHLEKTAPIPGFEALSRQEVFSRLAEAEQDLHVLTKLSGFSLAANQILAQKGVGSFHLVVLDSTKRTVNIRPFPSTQLEAASAAYSQIEERGRQGEQVEAVLVSAGPVEALRKAYPNYFLDTHDFVTTIRRVITEAGGS